MKSKQDCTFIAPGLSRFGRDRKTIVGVSASRRHFHQGRPCPKSGATYSKPFDLFVRGNETGEWRAHRD